jgi:hypothetical protein
LYTTTIESRFKSSPKSITQKAKRELMAIRTIQTERALAWMMANKNKTPLPRPLPRHDDTTFYGDDSGMSNGFDTDIYEPVETCLEG